MIFRSAVNALVCKRQHITTRANFDEYEKLFRTLSPVQTDFWTSPGSPPWIQHRADFDDTSLNFDARAERQIIKGRFRGGAVGYIFADEVELFAAAYMKEQSKLSFGESEILELLQREGPLSVTVIKEFTGMLVKTIAPLLHKLAEKYLVFEDQFDNEWDKAWYIFKNEFPNVNLYKYTRTEAIKLLILRFAYANAFINEEMIRGFYGFTLKNIKPALLELLDEKKICEERTDRENGYILTDDYEFLCAQKPIENFVRVFNRNDFLVKSNEHKFKDLYKKSGSNILYYIMVDGEFCGAVMGRFRFTPTELHDVLLDLPKDEIISRKAQIINEIYRVCDQTESPLAEYMGEPLFDCDD